MRLAHNGLDYASEAAVSEMYIAVSTGGPGHRTGMFHDRKEGIPEYETNDKASSKKLVSMRQALV